jgi:multiple sugar transport system ATP-binding protein
MNLLPCKLASLSEKQITLEFANGSSLALPVKGESIAARGTLTLGVRPEHVELVSPSEGMRATVDLVEHLGDTVIVYVELPKMEQTVAIKLQGDRDEIKAGDVVGIRPSLKNCVLFNTAGKSVAL